MSPHALILDQMHRNAFGYRALPGPDKEDHSAPRDPLATSKGKGDNMPNFVSIFEGIEAPVCSYKLEVG